jgi:hypothetical protein
MIYVFLYLLVYNSSPSYLKKNIQLIINYAHYQDTDHDKQNNALLGNKLPPVLTLRLALV